MSNLIVGTTDMTDTMAKVRSGWMLVFYEALTGDNSLDTSFSIEVVFKVRTGVLTPEVVETVSRGKSILNIASALLRRVFRTINK